MTDYSKPSILSYNDSPPDDDGETSTDNKIAYSSHKTKLADPVKDYAVAINAAANTAFAALEDDNASLKNNEKGSSGPSNIPIRVGSLWLDDSVTPWLLKIYDSGGGWTTLWEIHPTNNTGQVQGFVDESIDGAAIANDNVHAGHLKVASASVSGSLAVAGNANNINVDMAGYAFFPMFYSASHLAIMGLAHSGLGSADQPRLSFWNGSSTQNAGAVVVTYQYVTD